MGMRRTESGWVVTVLLIGSVLALCAVPGLFYRGFTATFSFWASEEAQSAANVATRERYYLAALLVALVASLVGSVVAWRARWTGLTVLMGLVLFVSVTVGLFAVADRTESPEPPPGPRPCQERSGGDTDCPGG
jgi:hypothetical protein